MKIDFYTGPQCSLCDVAMSLLDDLDRQDLDITKKNVREDADLYHLYGARIPVLKICAPNTHRHFGQELSWPFDLPQLQDFIA